MSEKWEGIGPGEPPRLVHEYEWPYDDPDWDNSEPQLKCCWPCSEFGDCDLGECAKAASEIDQAKAQNMGRAIRIAVVQNVFDQGLLTEAQAREILSGPLSPGGDNVFDDSGELKVQK